MITIMVRVKPGSPRDEITLQKDGTWLIRIRERPVKGAANEYLVRYLAEEWNLAKSGITLEKGAAVRYKRISLAIPEETFAAIKDSYPK